MRSESSERNNAAPVRETAADPDAERLQSVKRALAVLEALAVQPEGMTPKELGQTLSLHLSTSYRLLNTLVAAGYAVREGGLFRLGPRIAFLHHGYLAAVTPPPHVLAFVHALQQTTGETAMLSRLEGDDLTSVAVVAASRPEAHPPGYVGMAAPAHAVAAGKLLLAWLPPADLDAYLERRSRETVPLFPLTNPDAFRAELKRVRETGYALDLGGERQETCCVAAPVIDPDGGVTASISVLVPCSRFRRDEPSLIATVCAVASALGTLWTIVPVRAERRERTDDEPAPHPAAVEAAMTSLARAMSRVG